MLNRSYDRVVKNSESHLEPNNVHRVRHSIQCLCNPAYIILSRYGLKEHKTPDKQNATRKGDTDMLSYGGSRRSRKLLNREIYFVAKLGVHKSI